MGKKVRHAFPGGRQLRLRIDEGLTPHPDERRLRLRDRSGQKLKDVIDPRTGFCTGVTGPMEPDGTCIRDAKPTSGAGTPLPTHDPITGAWWVGADRLVVRTTTTPDGPLHRTRVVKASTLNKNGHTPDEQKRTKKPVTARQQASLASRKGPRYTDTEIRVWVAEHTGYKGKLTRAIRTSAISCMVKASTVQEYSQDLRSAGSTLKTGVAKSGRV